VKPSITTKSEAVLVLESLSKLMYEKPYFKSIELANDDAGIHIELRIKRSALPEEGPPHIGAINGVRICVMVIG
jgi:hypothetical protein